GVELVAHRFPPRDTLLGVRGKQVLSNKGAFLGRRDGVVRLEIASVRLSASVGGPLGRSGRFLVELPLYRLALRQHVARQPVEVGLARAVINTRPVARPGAKVATLGSAQVVEDQHDASPSWSFRSGFRLTSEKRSARASRQSASNRSAGSRRG